MSKSKSTEFTLSSDAFEVAVLINGKFIPNVAIRPYTAKKLSDNKVSIAGVDLKSAVHDKVLYTITKTGDSVLLERQGGVFSGSLGLFKLVQ